MIILNFTKKIVQSKILDTYIAAGFFSTLIFFTINASSYTPLEMIFGTIMVTIAFKGLANLMLALLILLYDLKAHEDITKYKTIEDKLDLLINELKLKEAQIKSSEVVGQTK